jgi:hypothetical protein
MQQIKYIEPDPPRGLVLWSSIAALIPALLFILRASTQPPQKYGMAIFVFLFTAVLGWSAGRYAQLMQDKGWRKQTFALLSIEPRLRGAALGRLASTIGLLAMGYAAMIWISPYHTLAEDWPQGVAFVVLMSLAMSVSVFFEGTLLGGGLAQRSEHGE